MKINVPWWLNPWAEVRRLRGRVAYHRDAEECAVRSLMEVQSYAAAELRHLRMREAAIVAENTRLMNLIIEQANMAPRPPVFIPPMRHRCETCQVVDGHAPGCAENAPPEDPLPEGVFEMDGRMMFTCRSCDKSVPLEVELHEFDPDVAYCGGSPRCLP